MQRMIEFIVGLLFGLGLLIAGMTDPGKVLGFLDLAGTWDPSLAFVMGGGVMVGLLGFGLAKKKTTSLSGQAFHWPDMTQIDRPLVLGSLMFGAGWGLAGFAQVQRWWPWRLAMTRPWCLYWPCWLAWLCLGASKKETIEGLTATDHWGTL